MIRVERGPAPPELDGDDSVGGRELAACISFYEGGQGDKPTFRAYKNAKVRNVLVERFRRKCAYCESKTAHVAPEDIEHYRPKSTVKLGDGTEVGGYWWRAMDWDNLLLSCIKCNRLNKEDVVGETNPRTVGKGNWFPLVDESKRAGARGGEGDEQPILLDPCNDNPGNHLHCGNPAEGVEEDVLVGRDERGRRSIDIYGLNRSELVDERRKLLLRLRFDLQELDLATEELNELLAEAAPPERVRRKEESIARRLARLKGALDKREQYLMLTRQVVTPALAEMGISVDG